MRKIYNLSTKQTTTSLTYNLAYKKQICKSYSTFWIVKLAANIRYFTTSP